MNVNAVSRTLLTLGLATLVFGSVQADHKHQSLPPGLEKNVKAGKSLPPGWAKKLAVGERLDHEVYEHASVVTSDDDGLVTIKVEGKLIQIMENTLEIVDILESL